MTKKYKINKNGRIVALRDFGTIKKGDIGGYIDDHHNLSHEGNCWVFSNAKISDNAKISGDAIVYGNAKISDNAIIYGNAIIS